MMLSRQLNLFDDSALSWSEQLEITTNSLNQYGKKFPHWVVCFSGGKDSTATVTVIDYLFKIGAVKKPEKIDCIYVDTRQELLPLQKSAHLILNCIKSNGWGTWVAVPRLDDLFLVYVLGRGVPPPNNSTFRWCTNKLKLKPIKGILKQFNCERAKTLLITGVRLGESAVRDRRILTSCNRNSGECGQGWYQKFGDESQEFDTLAPILTWRVCQVWDWLWQADISHSYPTSLLAEVYGGEQAVEKNTRTGCVGCPLATEDVALSNLIRQPEWAYLAPLKKLRPLYKKLRSFEFRLQKAEPEILKNGKIGKNPGRKGPLTLEARRCALEQILGIQEEINDVAILQNREQVEILTTEEVARIEELIELNTWPKKWTGEEPLGSELLGQYFADGSYQPTIFEAPFH